MRKITNEKKFYNTISKTGLATFVGSAGLVSKTIIDSMANYEYPNKLGLFLGIGIMYTGLYAHIYSHLNKSKYSIIISYKYKHISPVILHFLLSLINFVIFSLNLNKICSIFSSLNILI